MPHGPGRCRGWNRGPYDVRTMCRVCWLKHNKPVPVATVPLTTPTPQERRPECIHLGPIIEQAAIPGCDKHVYDCDIHDRCKRYDWPSRPVACCETCKEYAASTSDGLTIAVTYWNRPAALERLQKSIDRYLPNIPVIIEDTGGNLSAGRNRLYAKVKTKYLIMMEEDFVILPQTAKGVSDAVDILNHDIGIAGVGGIAWEPNRGPVRWGHNWLMGKSVVRPTPSNRPVRKTPGGITYRPCDLILNWGVFRTEIFQRVPWDEDFPIMEHQEQFWRMNRAGYEFAFYNPLRVNHLRDRPTKHYRDSRYRSFAHLVKKKHGFMFGREV